MSNHKYTCQNCKDSAKPGKIWNETSKGWRNCPVCKSTTKVDTK